MPTSKWNKISQVALDKMTQASTIINQFQIKKEKEKPSIKKMKKWKQ